MADKSTFLLILGGLALLATAANAGAYGALFDTTAAEPPMIPPPDQSTANDAAAAVESEIAPESRVAALLAVIRRFESRNDYSILYGGGHFTDFSQHPRIRIPFTNPRTGKQDYSTAAGAYQINAPTYDEFAPALGITDFSPASQDALALAILKRTGAFDAAASGDIQNAFALASRRWASLPGSVAQQNPQTLETALNAFDAFLTG